MIHKIPIKSLVYLLLVAPLFSVIDGGFQSVRAEDNCTINTPSSKSSPQRLLPWGDMKMSHKFNEKLTRDYRNSLPPRIVQNMNRDWTFNYFPSAECDTSIANADYDDRQWPAIALPHTWSTYETTKEVHPFIRSASEQDDPYWWYGWGWYRKHFVVDRLHIHKKVFIEFDGVQKYCKFFINGRPAGEHKGGFSSFCYDVTDLLHWGKDNVLAVAVSNRRDDPMRIPPMTAGNWDVYGGIYRNVRVVIKDRLYFPFQGSHQYQGGMFVTTPHVTNDEGIVNIQAWAKNDYTDIKHCGCSIRILDMNQHCVATIDKQIKQLNPGQTDSFLFEGIVISNPALWSPRHPNIYTVVAELYEGTRLTDRLECPLGFRWFRWDRLEKALYLNGEKMHLHGTNRHQDYPWLGDAVPKWMQIRDMQDIRFNLGCNFMRTVHYPNDPLIYDLCDQWGIIVVEESPNIKNIDFDEIIQHQHIREMIRRDRNHPSILFWSMGNETSDAADSQWAIDEDRSRIIHARKVHGDSAGAYVTNDHTDIDLESMLRVTIRGWYDSDVMPLEPENGQHAGNEEWQHIRARVNNGSVRGRIDKNNMVHWCYADHGADREYKNCPLKHINPKGAVDLYRFPKYFYRLWQANYCQQTMVFIHGHVWQRKYMGQRKTIIVDSNCEQVELLVNGVSKGVREPTGENFYTVQFEQILVEPGELLARGKRGSDVVESRVIMAGDPKRIQLYSSHNKISSGREGIAVICADVTDENGHSVYGFSGPLKWNVEGAGKLVGPDQYVSDKHKNLATEGVMYIVTPVCNLVRSGSKPGDLWVKVTSPGLEAAEMRIRVQPTTGSLQSGIKLPKLSDKGRGRIIKSYTQRLPSDYVEYIAPINGNAHLSPDLQGNYHQAIKEFILSRKDNIDPKAPAFYALLKYLANYLNEMKGELVADDFNFLSRQYNDCQALSDYMKSMNFSAEIMKQCNTYYAAECISRGVLKDIEREKRLLQLQRKCRKAGELWIYDVSSSPSSGHVDAMRTVDGDVNTCWTPTDPQFSANRYDWLIFDLGCNKRIYNLMIRFADRNNKQKYTIEISNDQQQWDRIHVVEYKNHPRAFQTFKMNDISARFVRIRTKRDKKTHLTMDPVAEVVITEKSLPKTAAP